MRSRRPEPDAQAALSQRPRASRRATALATLAFATTVSPTAAALANGRGKPRAATQQTQSRPAGSPRLAGRVDVDVLAERLGVHPGRAAAALRAVDAGDTSIDPVTALAAQLGLPVTRVGLALAAAAHS